jgi:hypothetical protein
MLAFRNHQPANNDRTLDRHGPVWLQEERPRKEKAVAQENLVNRKPKPLIQNHRRFLQCPSDIARRLTCCFSPVTRKVRPGSIDVTPFSSKRALLVGPTMILQRVAKGLRAGCRVARHQVRNRTVVNDRIRTKQSEARRRGRADGAIILFQATKKSVQ